MFSVLKGYKALITCEIGKRKLHGEQRLIKKNIANQETDKKTLPKKEVTKKKKLQNLSQR